MLRGLLQKRNLQLRNRLALKSGKLGKGGGGRPALALRQRIGKGKSPLNFHVKGAKVMGLFFTNVDRSFNFPFHKRSPAGKSAVPAAAGGDDGNDVNSAASRQLGRRRLVSRNSKGQRRQQQQHLRQGVGDAAAAAGKGAKGAMRNRQIMFLRIYVGIARKCAQCKI